MANTFNTEISITPAQFRLLKAVRRKKKLSPDDEANLRVLYDYDLISFESTFEDNGLFGDIHINLSTCTITRDGRDYIRYNADAVFRANLAIVIAVSALLIQLVEILLTVLM